MDDLLLKVLNFLVIPESSLSIVFLVLFLLCFGYGLMKVSDCKKSLADFHENGVANYQQESYRLNQMQYMSKFIAALGAKEVKIIDMPNIFVSIGILGTFLGLGVAIHGAADLLNADRVDLMQLNAVLSVIAFKFQTSVWGTIFSLIFQKFILEPYFVHKQGQLGDVETAIYADAINQSTAMQWQLAELQGMHAAQNEIKTALYNSSNSLGNNEQAVVNALRDQSKSLSEMAEKISSSRLEDNARQLKDFQNIANEIVVQQKSLNETMSAQNLANNGRMMTELLAKIEELVGDERKNSVLSIKELLTRINTIVGDSNDSNMKIAAELLQKVDSMVGDVNESNLTGIQDLLKQIGQLLGSSEDVNTKTAHELLTKVNELLVAAAQNNSMNLRELMNKVTQLVGDTHINNAKMTKDLLTDVSALVNESKSTNAAITKEVLDKVVTFVDDSNMASAALTSDLVEKVNTLVSDSNMSNAAMTKELLEKVNILVSDSNMTNANMTKDLMEKVNVVMGETSVSNAKMTQELLADVKALVGDAQEISTENGKSVMANVAEQLLQQKNEIQEMLARQNEINEKLKVQHEVLLENAEVNNRESMEKNTENIRQVLDKVSTLVDESKSSNAVMTKELLDNVKSLVGDAQDYATENGKSILGGVAEQLAQQREHMSDLVKQQTQLNEVLLGDVAETEAAHAKNMREGIVQQMEEYKQYARKLAEEQKLTQKALENRLEVLSNDMDKNSDTSNENITELRRAIDVLQKAIDTNSEVLEGIVDNFVDKQRDMDELRRSEIKAMAESFGTLFNQESQNTATWRKMKENLSRNKVESNSAEPVEGKKPKTTRKSKAADK